MRSSELWLAPALTAALVLVGAAGAQPPGQPKGPPRRAVQPARVGVDDVVARVLAFDKNKDGKVAPDELPERMHDLIARGDADKDGVLDKDEVTKLASTPAGPGPDSVGFGRGGGFGIVGPGPGAPGGQFRTGPGPGAAGGQARFGPGLEGVVDDLKLTGTKKEQAEAVIKAHEENVRRLMDQARTDLLRKMKEVLSAEEFQDFQAALNRPRGVVSFNFGPPDAPRPGELEQKLDRLQKELDEMRRQLRR
jgi:hypothetical protein